MSERYIAFDVETPNSFNDRMSAIGVTVLEDGAVTEEFYSLINPQTHFDRFNIRLTGITPQLVSKAPSFPELWERLLPLMSGGVLAAHNAPFDMCVLAKCLCAYGIDWKPDASYVCTCVMGRSCYPGLYNHRLNTLCAHVGISLDHHHAGSDSRACAELLLDYMRHGLLPARFIRRYDFSTRRTLRGVPGGCAI